MLETCEKTGNKEYEEERGETDGKGGDERAPDAAGSGITDISGAVDADGAGRHLGDGDDFGELGRGEPLMAIDDLMLNKGEHGITASEAENADFGINKKELPVNHVFCFLMYRDIHRVYMMPPRMPARMIKTGETPPSHIRSAPPRGKMSWGRVRCRERAAEMQGTRIRATTAGRMPAKARMT